VEPPRQVVLLWPEMTKTIVDAGVARRLGGWLIIAVQLAILSHYVIIKPDKPATKP
jgi:hypothetical protein